MASPGKNSAEPRRAWDGFVYAVPCMFRAQHPHRTRSSFRNGWGRHCARRRKASLRALPHRPNPLQSWPHVLEILCLTSWLIRL